MGFFVGVGASAGGLDSLQRFFKNVPNRDDITFVVVQHLSPDYKSMMSELLTKFTTRRIFIVEDGVPIESGCIYLIPPSKQVSISSGALYLKDFEAGEKIHLPIDQFFNSLAQDQREKAIGVVLSGAGSDGTIGISAIKKGGGLIIVQDTCSAQFSSMPSSAINTGLVDLILCPEEMGERIAEYADEFSVGLEWPTDTKFNLSDESLVKVYDLIAEEINLDITYYKQNTMHRRLARRMEMSRIDGIKDYYRYLCETPLELKSLCNDILIGVTQFFRDPSAFEYINTYVIPEIMERKQAGEPIRIWIAGCSTGEEAYSVAILFYDYIKKHGRNHPVKIFASDIDANALEVACRGVYASIHHIPAELQQTYFLYNQTGYKVCDTIRDMIVFSRHNLIKDPPFSKIDFLSCRNLLIYLQPVLQKKVMSLFNYSVHMDGYLFLGSSETVGEYSSVFHQVKNNMKIYQKKGFQYSPRSELDFAEIKSFRPMAEYGAFQRNCSQNPMESLYKVLVQDYLESAVIVDETYNILLICGKANEYLSVPNGRPSINIIHMVHPKAMTPLMTALRRTFNQNQETCFRYHSKNADESIQQIEVVASRFPELKNFPPMAILKFVEILETEQILPSRVAALDKDASSIIMELEQELQFSRENLQSTVEELETSSEEMQATNEELLSSNEELQSTNEELQAVNEELVTLNSEYQIKIGELGELNNDMDNFLSTTNIGVVFLDRDLNIRKYTEAAANVINLIHSDIGRSISHFSHNLIDVDIPYYAKRVLEHVAPIEQEVLKNNGEIYILKIYPYRTRENFIKGVTMAFINVTELRQAQLQLKKLEEKEDE